LQGVWEDIVEKTQQEGFAEFRGGVFLVALAQSEPDVTKEESIEDTWRLLTGIWDWEMDIDYIPAETLEVRMESQFGLSS
jgi:hypothetical protein